MNRLVVSSPAKLNLFLAITGRRADGFHDLVSVATPLEFGDRLTVEVGGGTGAGEEGGAGGAGGKFELVCSDATLAVDETNLVLRAARAFAEASGLRGGAKFFLEKRIPVGAGLGGGSSNATAALRALNDLTGRPLGDAELARVAAGIGSDCALFLRGGPVVMRGRGEDVRALDEAAAERLRGRRVLVFKPAFGISTVWAYRQMAAGAPASYLPAAEAESRLAAWCTSEAAPAEELLFNNMEAPAFAKYVALPVALERLRAEFGLAPRMSGSGSACFALLANDTPVDAVVRRIRELWGAEAFVVETRLA